MNYVTTTEIKSEATKKIEKEFQVSDQTPEKEEFTSQLNESKDNQQVNPNVASIEQSDQIDQQKGLDIVKEKIIQSNLKSLLSDSYQNISQATRISLESTFETQNISNQQDIQQSSVYVDENKEEIKGSKLWKKFKNIWKGISFFQFPAASKVEDFDQYIENFKQSLEHSIVNHKENQRRRIQDLENNAIEDFRRQEILFYLVTRGSQRDVNNLQQLLNEDPNRFKRVANDPENLINQHNNLGQNPLYVAARHGHTQIVQFLLEKGANPHLKSKAGNTQENVLAVTAR